MAIDERQSKPTILVVDDDPTNLRFLNEILKEDYQPRIAPSGARALEYLRNKTPDLILLDVEMPEMDGYEVIRAIKGNPQLKDIPVIFLTGQEGRDKEQEALDLGAVDYILKPISAGIVRKRAGLHIELEDYRKSLERAVRLRTAQLRRTQDAILNILASTTSYRDSETGQHVVRTTHYTRAILECLMKKNHPDYQISEEYAESMIRTAKLHDIGKVSVPDSILLKPARLTMLEFEVMKQHTSFGGQIIDDAVEDMGEVSPFLVVAREIVTSHHEKWNGLGYPNGLAGSAIPLSGRIMALADVYDALISKRPYKSGFTHEKSISIIRQDAGTHFDPYLVDLCAEALDEFWHIAQAYKDKPMSHNYTA